MSRTPKSASIEQIATTALTTLNYEVPVNTVSTAYLVLTNLTSNVLDIAIYINNSEESSLLVNSKIPSGIGKTWVVSELITQKLNAGFTVQVQATTTNAFNAFLSVSEISDS